MDRHQKSASAIEWRGPEFLFKKKTLLWYTHIVVFFFIIVALLLFTGNWPGAIVVTILFVIFILKSNDKPRIITYQIDDTGITAGDTVTKYSEIHSFTLDNSHAHPVIVLDLNYYLALPITLVVKKDQLEDVQKLLLSHLPMQRSVPFLRWLTHLLHY